MLGVSRQGLFDQSSLEGSLAEDIFILTKIQVSGLAITNVFESDIGFNHIFDIE